MGPHFLSSLWQQPSHSKYKFVGGCCLWSSMKPKAGLLLAMWPCLSYSNSNFPPNYSLQDHQAVLRQQIWVLLKDSQIAITKGLNLLLMSSFQMENLTVALSCSCSSCVKGSCFKGFLAKEPYQMSSGNPGQLHQQPSMWIKAVDLNPPKHFTCVRCDPTLLNPPCLFPVLLLTLSSLFLLFVAVPTCLFSVNIRMDPQGFNELLWLLLHSFKHQISGCIQVLCH